MSKIVEPSERIRRALLKLVQAPPLDDNTFVEEDYMRFVHRANRRYLFNNVGRWERIE